jgi:hypothetical protein
MKILLDENFPLPLVRQLQQQGYKSEHIILLGLRGTPGANIIARLDSENLLFLPKDQEFLDPPSKRSTIIVSRVTQSLPVGARIEIWLAAIREYCSIKREEKLFELFDDGKSIAWEVVCQED